MKLRQLFEAEANSIAFCFGRMNPPTIGHGQVFDTLAKTNKNYRIYVSPAQTPKKDNPLDFSTKIKFIKEMFPQHASRVSDNAGLNTIMKIAVTLYEEGYKNITVVAGSDRLESFSKLLNEYNGVESAHGMYKFENINLVSSGDRDPDAEGLEGISASAAREAARAGDLEKFSQVTGAGKSSEDLYNSVRAGLKIKEDWFGGVKSIGPWFLKKDGDVIRTVNGEPFTFKSKEEAVKWAMKTYKISYKQQRIIPTVNPDKNLVTTEAPIEMDPTDPMDPMIHSHDKANPAKLKYRMLRASVQLKDLAARAQNASPSEWQLMARQFEELKMNMEQIRHGLDELGKMRKKGGIRSRGIDPMVDNVSEGYGRYWCSTDKKWKTRKGPKQKRS